MSITLDKEPDCLADRVGAYRVQSSGCPRARDGSQRLDARLQRKNGSARLVVPARLLFTLRDPELLAVYNSGRRHTVRRVQRVEHSEIKCNPPEGNAAGVPLPMHGTGALLNHGCMVQQHLMLDGSSACESPSIYSLETGGSFWNV